MIEFNDPNPKGRKRKDTVLNKKLPVTNRIVKFSEDFSTSSAFDVKSEGEIICAAQSDGIIYYLHNSKRATIFDIKREKVVEVQL